MRQILPGVHHWTTFHERIGHDVDSYFITAVEPAVLIDPRMPTEGLAWFERRPRPAHILLTNRHHYRHSDRFEKAFGCDVRCHRAGLHEFTRGQKVRSFRHGDRLPGGILALEVGALCPEETALFVPAHGGILCIGDAVIRERRRLMFVPDAYMGDDPEGVKRGLRRALKKHLRRRFDTILFAHGRPIVGGGRDTLRAFLEAAPA